MGDINPMQPTEKSARHIIMEYLNKEICMATTGNLHRAANFLEKAREIQSGKKSQRSSGRREMHTSRMRKVDKPVTW